jgi:hypothetical protein
MPNTRHHRGEMRVSSLKPMMSQEKLAYRLALLILTYEQDQRKIDV